VCERYRKYEMSLEEKLSLILGGKTEEEVFTSEQIEVLNKLRIQLDVMEGYRYDTATGKVVEGLGVGD
jgi:hypothetical protein